jgi:hypothetical protein
MAGLGKQEAGTPRHRWRFFRSGGFDQVRVESADDLRNLGRLDQKLWAALACPTAGVELDERTLALLDADGDRRIRPPELLEAVRWACSVLKDPGELTRRAAALPLASIDDGNPEGARLLASARQILANLGKAEAAEVSAEDTADTTRIFAHTHFNGDGVVPPEAAEEPAVRAAIEDVLRCAGSVTDRNGAPGVTGELVDTFFTEARRYADWWAEAGGSPELRPLGEKTEAGAVLFEAVKGKVDDYFTRCRLATYDPRAAEALNPALSGYEALAGASLSRAAPELAALPLARIEPARPLPLAEGLNPAWAEAIGRLRRDVVEPILGPRTTLAAEEWEALCDSYAAYEAWLGRKQGTLVEPLGLARVRELLAGDVRGAIDALIARDQALEPEANAIASVERLVRYYRDLDTLLNNFVSLRDFYTGQRAIFQAGTLYLDGRSCQLCVRVDDVAKHSSLANLSRTYLAYCECVRRGSGEQMTIAAAFTAGDADNLMVGRNGVFYDRKGRDWDATIVKVLDHPISVGQAFWSPYKRFARLIGEQIEKMAGAKDKALEEKAAAGITEATQKAEAGKGPTAPFDIAKFAGIFAAIGLAIGAIGTAVASVLTGFLALTPWQMPLALVGIVLAISGPSMVIAYLKLRQRNLAPILDANGWAVNTLARINIPFGGSLTDLAALPPGAERSLTDPFAEKRRPWKTYLVLAAILGALAYLGYQGYLGQWLGQLRQKAEETAAAGQQAAPPAAPAEAAKPAPAEAPRAAPAEAPRPAPAEAPKPAPAEASKAAPAEAQKPAPAEAANAAPAETSRAAAPEAPKVAPADAAEAAAEKPAAEPSRADTAAEAITASESPKAEAPGEHPAAKAGKEKAEKPAEP